MGQDRLKAEIIAEKAKTTVPTFQFSAGTPMGQLAQTGMFAESSMGMPTGP